MKKILYRLKQFENWFNKKFGWFFINGRKQINYGQYE